MHGMTTQSNKNRRTDPIMIIVVQVLFNGGSGVGSSQPDPSSKSSSTSEILNVILIYLLKSL